MTEVNDSYGKTIPVFPVEIPMSVRVSETSQIARTIYDYDPNGKAAAAYQALTKEVIKNGCYSLLPVSHIDFFTVFRKLRVAVDGEFP